MTSPETPTPEPPRSAFVIGDGSWKAMIPFATLLSIFLIFLVGMLTWFDIRIDGVERRLTAQIGGVETRLSARIDQVETSLNARIDRVETRLTAQIDEVKSELKTELAASEARRAAVDAQLSADIERVAAGVAENRLAHRELAAFVRASLPANPSPATAEQGAAPAQ